MAVAARNFSSAQDFATRYGVHHPSATYEELTQDPTVDVNYSMQTLFHVLSVSSATAGD